MQARQLNPAETAQFQADMASLPEPHQADVALKWRERCVNALTTYVPTPAKETLMFGSAAGYAALMGTWDGANDADRNAMIETWRAEAPATLGVNLQTHPTPFRDVVDPATGQTIHKAIPDPRNWYGLNKTAYPTLGLLVASVGVSVTGKGAPVNPFLKAGALAGGGYLLGSTFRDMAYTRRANQIESGAVAPPSNGNGANGEGGPAENPCGGYPRAVA